MVILRKKITFAHQCQQQIWFKKNPHKTRRTKTEILELCPWLSMCQNVVATQLYISSYELRIPAVWDKPGTKCFTSGGQPSVCGALYSTCSSGKYIDHNLDPVCVVWVREVQQKYFQKASSKRGWMMLLQEYVRLPVQVWQPWLKCVQGFKFLFNQVSVKTHLH